MGIDMKMQVEVLRGTRGGAVVGERLILAPCWRGTSRVLHTRRLLQRESAKTAEPSAAAERQFGQREFKYAMAPRPSALDLLPVCMMAGAAFAASVRAKPFKRWHKTYEWERLPGLERNRLGKPGPLSRSDWGQRNYELYWMLCGTDCGCYLDLSHARPIFADCGPGGQLGWPKDTSLDPYHDAARHCRGKACYTVEALASVNWNQPLSERTDDPGRLPAEWRELTCRQFVNSELRPNEKGVEGWEEELAAFATLAPDGDPGHVRVLLSFGGL